MSRLANTDSSPHPARPPTTAISSKLMDENKHSLLSRLGASPWETAGLDQVLLTVSCALFIVGVIVLITCCLIKKRKSQGHWKRNSIPTDSHTSECGIYDVIDQVKGRGSFYPARKTSYHYDNVDCSTSSCPVVPSRAAPPRDIFTTTVSGIHGAHTPISRGVDSSCDRPMYKPQRNFPAENVSIVNDYCTPPNMNYISSHEPTDSVYSEYAEEYDEERIYETLDKQWKFNSETSNQQSAGDYGECEDVTSRSGEFKIINQNHACNSTDFALGTHACIPGESLSAEGHTLCQLTIFKTSETGKMLTSAESGYYFIFSEDSPSVTVPSKPDEFKPFLSPNIQLRMVPSKDNIHNSRGIILEPVENTSLTLNEKLKMSCFEEMNSQQFSNFLTQCDSEAICKRNVASLHTKNRAEPCVKQVNSFKESSPGIDVFHGRRNESPNSGFKTQSPPSQARITPETANVLSKLGPLPPVPVSSANELQPRWEDKQTKTVEHQKHPEFQPHSQLHHSYIGVRNILPFPDATPVSTNCDGPQIPSGNNNHQSNYSHSVQNTGLSVSALSSLVVLENEKLPDVNSSSADGGRNIHRLDTDNMQEIEATNNYKRTQSGFGQLQSVGGNCAIFKDITDTLSAHTGSGLDGYPHYYTLEARSMSDSSNTSEDEADCCSNAPPKATCAPT